MIVREYSFDLRPSFRVPSFGIGSGFLSLWHFLKGNDWANRPLIYICAESVPVPFKQVPFDREKLRVYLTLLSFFYAWGKQSSCGFLMLCMCNSNLPMLVSFRT